MEPNPQVDRRSFKLGVEVFGATNLPGKAAYVTLEFEGQTQRTREVVAVNPLWKQTFVFNVSSYLVFPYLELHASVYSGGVFVGEASLTWLTLSGNGSVTTTLKKDGQVLNDTKITFKTFLE